MQKPKRKIGQRNLWQRFYARFILLRHDFRYEIDHKPKKVVPELRKYLYKRWPGLYYYHEQFKLTEEKAEEHWRFDLNLPSNYSKVNGEIYLEDGRTLIQGTITYRTTIMGAIYCTLALGIPFGVLLMLEDNAFLLSTIFGSVLIFAACLYSYFAHRISKQKVEEAIEFLEIFVEGENSKIERGLAHLDGKIKNEELYAETLKEKRK